MKLLPLILMLAGCAAPQPLTLSPMSTVQPEVVQPTIKWVWDAGEGWDEFVIVTSTDLTLPIEQWPTFAVTTETSFQVGGNEPQRFFTLYGTNADGESAWVK